MWYIIENIEHYDTPALVIYKERAASNIDKAISAIGDAKRLRPHVKTNKIAEICRMMMDRGITRFKCATIAEAEMLAMIGAADILLAYQPVGPKGERLLKLQQKYSKSQFSCIIDDINVAKFLSSLFKSAGTTLKVYVDVNTGMNRTGVGKDKVFQFLDELLKLPALEVIGLHAYDGHLREPNLQLRQQQSNEAFRLVEEIAAYAPSIIPNTLNIVAGGSPSFLTHIHRDVECSPGTFVFWDLGYQQLYPDEPYEFAALLISRIVSIVDGETITCDLGYKSVSSENPLPRVSFLNVPGAVPKGHSEEHMVVSVPDSSKYRVGDVLYAVPVHICPSIALYKLAWVCEDNRITGSWDVIAREREISV